MQQIIIRVDSPREADRIVDVLSDFEFIKSIDVDPVWQPDKLENHSAITIIESDMGPMISDSRASVYDVMDAYDEGYDESEISKIYNLSRHQVDVAIAYINKHRVILEPKLKIVLDENAKCEQYHRALVAKREKYFKREMTPERIKFNALLEQSRRIREQADASHSL